MGYRKSRSEWSCPGRAIGRDVTGRAREQAQHERIASLERQVAALSEGANAGDGDSEPGGTGDRPRP